MEAKVIPNFEDQLLEAKKQRYIAFVEEATRTFGIEEPPQVVFIDEFNPFDTKALAWIDVQARIIYCCLIHLREMSMEWIRHNAFHEVTHIINQTHDSEFHKILEEGELKDWKPDNPAGIIMIDGGRTLPKIEVKPYVPDPSHCNYHLCNSGEEMHQCPHCEKYFCEKHITPQPPKEQQLGSPNREFDNTKGNHHPCPPYYDFLLEQERIQIQRIDEVFKGKKKIQVQATEQYTTYYPKPERKSFWRRLRGK